MITVITLEELKKLHRDKKLEKSENFGIISDASQKLLSTIYTEVREATMGEIIYVHSVDGKPVVEVEDGIAGDSNGEILSYLPELEGSQICIVVKAEVEKHLHLTDIDLQEIEEKFDFSEEEVEFYRDIMAQGPEENSSCVYAIGPVLKFEDITAVHYPEDLEEEISKLKEEDKARAVLFEKTKLFN